MFKEIHISVQGRARFKIDGLYRSELLKSFLETALLENRGIKSCSASTLTGNILITYNSVLTVHSLSCLLREKIIAAYSESAAYRSLQTSSPAKSIRKRNLPSHRSSNKNSLSDHHDKKSRLKDRVLTLLKHTEPQKAEPWHCMEVSEVISTFETPKDEGLSSEAVKEQLKKYGHNLLPEALPRSGFSIFISQFISIPVALVSGGALISLLTGGVADAVAIMAVVGINAAIGYVTENQSERTINSLKRLVEPFALVKRDGCLQEIKAEDVVPGDIVVLRNGGYVPADARLIESTYLSVDESILTGESMPVSKTIAPFPQTSGEIPLSSRKNMVYMGTLIIGGQGLALVVATGKHTEMGMIQMLAGEARPPETPMGVQLKKIGTQLVWVCSIICGAVFIIGVLHKYSFLEMLKMAISLAVAAVPEGLPMVATTTLALGIRTMRRHNVLIRHLDAVETLGAIQTICLDKTGTLTLNKMSVVAIATTAAHIKLSNGRLTQMYRIPDEVDASPGDNTMCNIDLYSSDELLRLMHIAVLCNESRINGENGRHVVNGSSTENALIHMALSAGVNVIEIRKHFPLLRMIDRSERRNFMITYHGTPQDTGRQIIAIKGSPNEVLSICSWYIRDGKKFPLTDEVRGAIDAENERMAQNALRILAVAYVPVEGWNGPDYTGENGAEFQGSVIWLGLVGMADPIRDGVKQFIADLHEAGIDTVMITGDQSTVAYAIAKELNLSRDDHLEILDSENLADVNEEVMKTLSQRVHAFARVSPAHKLQIVQALQQAGRVVAMSGDGINDGPALKAANLGVAMGHTGTDVAREVADVVLEDDRLETMMIAISQGRTIYNNIRKSLHFILSTNLSEIMVTSAAITAGLGQPLNAMQLLWINLMSDIFPGLALALEMPEPDVLSHPPRNPREPIITGDDLKRMTFESAVITSGTLGAYGYGIMRYGAGQRASTLSFLTLTTAQTLHALSCRSTKHTIFSTGNLQPNRYLNAALGGTFILQAFAMLVPGLRGLLRIVPLSVLDCGIAVTGAVVPLIVNEMTKGFRAHRPEADTTCYPIPSCVSVTLPPHQECGESKA